MQIEKNSQSQRTIIILGDSYSSYEGYIPAGQDFYYPREEVPDVNRVELTWWHQFIQQNHLKLLKNDSWSGATICTSVRPAHPIDAAFVKRMQVSLCGELAPDMICIFGGTNDSWIDCPIGKNQYSDWSETDLRATLPAFCNLLAYTRSHNPQAEIFCVINTELKDEITQGMIEACQHYDVQYIQLQGIDKQSGHPTAKGMHQIAEQVTSALSR